MIKFDGQPLQVGEEVVAQIVLDVAAGVEDERP